MAVFEANMCSKLSVFPLRPLYIGLVNSSSQHILFIFDSSVQVTDPNLMVGKKKILSVREEQGAFRLPVATFHGGAFAAVLAEITSMKLLEHEARYVATGICNTVDVSMCGD